MRSNIDVNLIAHREMLGVENDPFLAQENDICLCLSPDIASKNGSDFGLFFDVMSSVCHYFYFVQF